MKILNISDTHGKHRQIPLEWMVDADVLIHAGDITNYGELDQLEDFLIWFSSLPYTIKCFVFGNHDFLGESHHKDYEATMKLIDEYSNVKTGIYHLNDSSITLGNGMKVYGSPWSPFFFSWAFNAHRGNKIQAIWDKIPTNTDILITHGPVYGILDKTSNGTLVGCENLAETIDNFIPDLKLHVCGHIHEAVGVFKKDNTVYVNASTLNEQYQVVNKPILIEL